jgi:hypothetical protein
LRNIPPAVGIASLSGFAYSLSLLNGMMSLDCWEIAYQSGASPDPFTGFGGGIACGLSGMVTAMNVLAYALGVFVLVLALTVAVPRVRARLTASADDDARMER